MKKSGQCLHVVLHQCQLELLGSPLQLTKKNLFEPSEENDECERLIRFCRGKETHFYPGVGKCTVRGPHPSQCKTVLDVIVIPISRDNLKYPLKLSLQRVNLAIRFVFAVPGCIFTAWKVNFQKIANYRLISK